MFARKVFNIKQFLSHRTALYINRFQFPEKWKGGRIEKWYGFWKNLCLDYKEVATGVIDDAKARPHKTVLVSSALGALITAIKTNPNEQSFHDSLTQCIATLTMVGQPIRNPLSEEHIQYLNRCQNQGCLRRMDLIFFTLLWVSDYSADCGIYAAQCKYLKPHITTFYERIIDVGAFGIWWNLRQKMKNFDINPSEWKEA